jgi:hypothetical protein
MLKHPPGLHLLRSGGFFSTEGNAMATVMPEGEAIRKAVKWISAEMSEHPDKSVQKLVSEAVTRFDLSPKDSEFLMSFYKKK